MQSSSVTLVTYTLIIGEYSDCSFNFHLAWSNYSTKSEPDSKNKMTRKKIDYEEWGLMIAIAMSSMCNLAIITWVEKL